MASEYVKCPACGQLIEAQREPMIEHTTLCSNKQWSYISQLTGEDMRSQATSRVVRNALGQVLTPRGKTEFEQRLSMAIVRDTGMEVSYVRVFVHQDGKVQMLVGFGF